MREAREIATSIRKAVAEGRGPAYAIPKFREQAHPPIEVASHRPTFRDAWNAYWALKEPQVVSDRNRLL
jgi:hypothetical protein